MLYDDPTTFHICCNLHEYKTRIDAQETVEFFRTVEYIVIIILLIPYSVTRAAP